MNRRLILLDQKRSPHSLRFSALLAFMLLSTSFARAATTQRYAIDDHGDFLMFGNTVGFDCRDGKVEEPVVGSVPIGLLGLFSCNGILPDSDTGIDIFWRSDYPGTSQATASNAIDVPFARSTATLTLPAGAQVLMARLYWAAQRSSGQGAGTVVTMERPGVFSKQLSAQAGASKTLSLNGLDYYQSSADITKDVQTYGNGAYRVGNIQTIDIRTRDRDVAFVAWNVVVFYHLDSEPIRNLALFDGLERVSTSAGSSTNVSLSGFSVPASGFGAKLGIIAYEGDNDITGDQLLVNGTAISTSLNPANNFFNRSSTVLDLPAPRSGDLPQMSGRPSSMAGYDSDVVDITARLSPGATQMNLAATTSGDEYFLGVFATAVSTIRPVFTQTYKTVTNLTRTDGRYLPGDMLEYVITTRNTGNDTGKLIVANDTLPAGLNFVAGSIAVTSGANTGTKTDTASDDQAEYNGTTRTVTVRLGTGANGTQGGDLAINETSTFRFRVTIDANAQGSINNQAFVSSVGATAQSQGATTPVIWSSGNGTSLQVPTTVVISTCNTNQDCTLSAPICDTAQVPHQCVCLSDNDCPQGQFCSPTTKSCVACIVGVAGQCNAGGVGGLCLPGGICGCNSNSDCNGRDCDPVLHICASVLADLSLSLSRQPGGGVVPPSTNLFYTLTVSNKSNTAVSGAHLDAAPSPIPANVTWSCTSQGGAVCPAASGSGAIATAVNLPPGAQLIYALRLNVGASQDSRSQDFTAVLTTPAGIADQNPGDNIAVDSVLIGVPPLGPDLSVNVREEVSTSDNSVTYVVEVTNHGPGTADSATVVYDVPAGTQVQVSAGDGWRCEQTADKLQVICTRTQPIPEGNASPIRITTIATKEGEQLPLHIAVNATDGMGGLLSDPNPADNTVDRTTKLNRFRLEGGGLVGCRYTPGWTGHDSTEAYRIAPLFGLLALAFWRRRARSTQACSRLLT